MEEREQILKRRLSRLTVEQFNNRLKINEVFKFDLDDLLEKNGYLKEDIIESIEENGYHCESNIEEAYDFYKSYYDDLKKDVFLKWVEDTKLVYLSKILNLVVYKKITD